MESTSIGFLPEEVRTGESTRTARLKWVVVVDDALPGGQAANAAVCVAAATSVNIAGLLGPGGSDATGSAHPGLPWAGCSILAANTGQLNDIRARAVARADVFVADMPSHAQRTRVYDEYLEHLSQTGDDQITYSAVSIVGPRNAVDKLVKKLPLLP